jgi:hypothetical protein
VDEWGDIEWIGISVTDEAAAGFGLIHRGYERPVASLDVTEIPTR